jgi:xylobiose transport system permease protein
VTATISTSSAQADGGTTQPPRRPRRSGATYRRPNYLGGLGAGVWLVIVGVPLYFLAVTAFRASGDYLSEGPTAPPTSLTLDNYVEVLTSQFPSYFINNLLVTVACVAIVLCLALPAAYAIVRSRSRLVDTSFSIMLLGLAVPSQAVIVPLYLMITPMRLYVSLLAIILPTAAFALPLSVVVLTASLRDIPN